VGSIYRPKYKDKTTGEVRESAIWWTKYYVHGRPRRESTETADHAEAKDFLKKREGEAASGRPMPRNAGQVTFADLATFRCKSEPSGRHFDWIGDVDQWLIVHFGDFFVEIRTTMA
jgi:hypothetical protein